MWRWRAAVVAALAVAIGAALSCASGETAGDSDGSGATATSSNGSGGAGGSGASSGSGASAASGAMGGNGGGGGVAGAGGEPDAGPDAADDGCVTTAYVAGPQSPLSAATNDQTVGMKEWTNLGNILVADAIDEPFPFSEVAWVRLSGGSPASYYLKVTNFGFALPQEALITGIEAEFRRSARDVMPGVLDLVDAAVRIVKGGVVGTVEHAKPGVWNNVFAYVSYGGATDLWGETWTASDVNTPTFGVALAMAWAGSAGNNDARVDHVRMTVYYESCN